ncbi:MAG TPA: TonB-dependent receptor [Vicinamibacterales bacterium]|nr:TonB-dependent receptor [Vicinamibacterales bacterium]
MSERCRYACRVVHLTFGALAVIGFLSATPLAYAQSLYGSIVGTVTDAQGSPTPGVVLTAANTGTGFKTEVTTDADGAYVFRNLLPGTYDVTATLTGFRVHEEKAITVNAGNPVRINVTLQVGTVSERVEVVSETTLLQTDKADLNTVLTSKEITNLPLNQYRNYQALINLVPGATPAQFQNAEIDTPGRSLRTWVNGTQPNSNATRIDGAVSVNIWLPHHVGYVQPAETIETVNISTNNFDADLGMAGGAAATVITKSGTNDLHGSAFEFYNSDGLNANTLFNNSFGIEKSPLSRNIYGGTVGGPILRNRLFFFGSWEKFRDRRGFTQTLAVPTAKMRSGDFSEVAAAYSGFRIYNPFTGGAGGVGRDQFGSFLIPSGMIDPIATSILRDYYPLPNTTQDLNSNQLLDDYSTSREIQVDRNNYDTKFTWQRNASHSVWGKFSVLNADVVNNFSLGFDSGSLGHTRVYVGTAGHTWTLTPSLVLDGNFGVDIQNQQVTGPDFGSNLGLELGIPGTNDPNDGRASGLPSVDITPTGQTFGQSNANTYSIGTTPNWMPLFRRERSYTFSSALTKAFATKHELRLGVDIVRHELNHRQAEFGTYGLRGGFTFSGFTTGVPGYTPLLWNNYASFLLGLANSFAKDVQTEEMTGREWQSAIYVRDRWNLTPKFTISAGLRMEYYPLMHRANHGIERLDYNTFNVLIGGLGSVPEDVGINLKTWYFAPRLGAMYRLSEKSVARAGYGRTINPLPWSRPMRGSFPYDINFNQTADQFNWVTTLSGGIPNVPIPDTSSGVVKLPQGVFMRSPNPDDVDRGIIQQWNIAYEYRLPWDISTEIAYVGTRTDGGYADLNINYGVPGGGNASRQYFAVAGTTAINDWAARTKSRYHALQVALNRPFKAGLALKGAYTLSRAKNMTRNDEDGWTDLTWNTPLMYDQNYALAGFDRTHVFQMGVIWETPFFRDSQGVLGKVLQGWQVNGVFAAFSGTPFSIAGTNSALDCQGCGNGTFVTINTNGDPKPVGSVGSSTEPYYPVEMFSQPSGANVAGFGNSGRNRFRRPPVWNADFSLFKAFPFRGIRPEFRLEVANVFNHPNWGAPVTTFTANNFMRFTPSSYDPGDGTGTTNTPGPRRVQLGFRVQF